MVVSGALQPPTQFPAGVLSGFLAPEPGKGGLQPTKRLLGDRNPGFWIPTLQSLVYRPTLSQTRVPICTLDCL